MRIRLLVVLALLAAGLAAGRAEPATAGRFYFHAGGAPVNQLATATFDRSAPTGGVPLAPGSQGLGLTPNPTWTGVVGGTIDSLTVDFWHKAPVADVEHTLFESSDNASYDVSLHIGEVAVSLGQVPVQPPSDVPARVVHRFSASDVGSGLPISPGNRPISIEIAGHFTDAQAATVILYDSAQYSSGFTVNDGSTLIYRGDDSAPQGGVANLSTILRSGGKRVGRVPIRFALGTQRSFTALTDRNGLATARQRISLRPGRYTLKATFEGTVRLRSATLTRDFVVTTGAFSFGVVQGNTDGAEPSIAVGPGDRMYVSYPASQGTAFYRSEDSGRTWTAGAIADPNSGDTSVNVDRTGAVYQSNLNLPQADVYKSFDGGRTWKQKGRAATGENATDSPGGVDRQWVDAYVPPGKGTNQARVYITYHDFATGLMWMNVSKDGGKTFGPQTLVTTAPEAISSSFLNTLPMGVKVVQSGPRAGRVYVAWIAGDPISNVLSLGLGLAPAGTVHQLFIAWSDDEGATWTNQLIYDAGIAREVQMGIPDLTLDVRGNPYVAFPANIVDGSQGPQFDIYVMASFNGGRTWNGKADGTGTPYRVTSGSGTRVMATIAAGAPGKVDVAYVESDTVIPVLPTGRPAPAAGSDLFGAASWRMYMAQSLNLATRRPAWRITQVTPNPMHTGDICQYGIACTPYEILLGANRDLLDFNDIAIDGKGFAHIAYRDDAREQGKVVVANQTGGRRVL